MKEDSQIIIRKHDRSQFIYSNPNRLIKSLGYSFCSEINQGNAKMKVLFVANSLRNYGGLEKWHIQVANALVERGHKVIIDGIDLGELKRIERGDIDRIINFEYTEDSSSLPESDVLYTSIGNRRIMKDVLEFRGPKIFGAHHGEYILYSNNDGIAWSSDLFSIKAMRYKIWFSRTLKLLPNFDMVHYNNHHLDWLVHINRNAFYLSNTVFQTVSNLNKSKDRFDILFFGRHETEKGFDTLLRIAKEIPNEITFNILGQGSRTSELSSIDRSNVHYLGQVKDNELYAKIASSHLVLIPSYSETSSLVIRESLSNGTPLIARNFDDLQPPPLCDIANSDSDFLNLILSHKEQFYSDPGSYIAKCCSLKNYVMSKSEYMDKFEGMLSKAIRNFEAQTNITTN